MKKIILIFFIVCVIIHANAQDHLIISGVVIDEKNEQIIGATVFLSGSEQITATNDKGQFALSGLPSGSYQLVVKMMGYSPVSQNVIVRQAVRDIKVVLKINTNQLSGVTISADRDWLGKYNVFKDNFLGTTKNSDGCAILNPDVLHLKYNRKTGILTGSSDDFLIIENKQLGYRVRYLLKVFEFHRNTTIANYDGETSFAELEGTPKQQRYWAKNRYDAYRGSLMHFLRSVYKGKDEPLRQGFFCQQIYDEIGDGFQGRMTRFTIDVNPIDFDKAVNVMDTSFVVLQFKKGLFINYSPNIYLTLKLRGNYKAGATKSVQFSYNASVLQLALKNAVIDSRGSFINYRAFLIRGEWGEKRIGDQLPFEYQPPK